MIRMTVQIEVPHDEEIMNYGYVARERIKEYVAKGHYGFLLENGAKADNET
jgi:hypothetical protein